MKSGSMKFFTVEKLGIKRSRTPEGYLLIEGVPIARTGTMIYGPDETPVQPGADGFVRIERNAEEVFRAETIASMSGKPITNDHPSEDVTPANWRSLSCGVALNPRRGDGIEDDFTIADLLIQDEEAIRLIEDGKVELSCGYDAEYDQLGPGHGRQRDIIYNHLALVDKGRCGPRCAIGDRQYKEITEMARTIDKKTPASWKRIADKLRKAFDKKDEELLEEGIGDAEKAMDAEEEESGKHHIEIHNHGPTGDKNKDDEEMSTEDRAPTWFRDSMKVVADRLDAMEEKIEKVAKDKGGKDEEMMEDEEKEEEGKSKDEKILGELEMEAPPGTNDKARKARDSVYLEDSFQETVALAEIIAPGIKIPTFDSKSPPKKSFDTICNLRRTALDAAYMERENRLLIGEVIGEGRPPEFKTMDCAAVRTIFKAVAASKRRLNNEGIRTGDLAITGNGGGTGFRGKLKTIADINAANRAYYAAKK